MEKPSTVAAVDAEALEREALAAVAGAADDAALEEARVRYLGRKSELKLALREVRDRESGDGAERAPDAPRGRVRGAARGARRGRPATRLRPDAARESRSRAAPTT